MQHPDYPHLFSPLRIGNFEVSNRVCHVPTDISSANSDGSVNQRVITYHEEIAKGGCGLIIVGALTPDRHTGRPTVACLSVDEDPHIPGLAELAEAMHRHGAKCSVQIQHPGRQAAWPRKDLMSASDQMVDIPGSAGHEIVYAEQMAQGKAIRAMTVEEIYDLIEKFAEGAWRVQQAGFDCVEFCDDKPLPTSCGDTVLIWGDHFGAADAAEKLASQGCKVYIVTEAAEFASWMEPCHKDVMMKRFAGSNGEGLKGKAIEHPVTIVPNSTVVDIADDGSVTLMDTAFRKQVLKVDNVVLANVQSENSLQQELLEQGVTAASIGDARQVRNLRAAVTEGANIGLTLDEGLQLNANRSVISQLPTEVRR